MRRFVSALVLLSALVVRLAAAAGCPAGATTAAFSSPGSFGVGVRTLALVDTTRPTPPHAGQPGDTVRRLTVEIWYPAGGSGETAQRNAAIADGKFPLILNSHGLLDSRLGEAYYATLLASRGFIVAAPDYPLTHLGVPGDAWLPDVQNQPGDVSFVITSLLAAAEPATTWLAGHMNRKRIGASGLSLGGATTALVTYHPVLRDRRVRAALGLATAGGCATTERFYRDARVPFLLLHGDQDLIVPYESNAVHPFELARRSRRQLVTLRNATHTAFSGFITFDLDTSYDEIGCGALADFASWGDPLAGLADLANGIDPGAAACVVPCQIPPPPNVPMQAARQHQLTRAVVAAFFESTLARSRSGRCFLRDVLAAENADVRVESRRPGR